MSAPPCRGKIRHNLLDVSSGPAKALRAKKPGAGIRELLRVAGKTAVPPDQAVQCVEKSFFDVADFSLLECRFRGWKWNDYCYAF
jgi:hypothetical protein